MKLAIKGHKTRGKEVIGILEMFGGKTSTKLSGNASSIGYYINSNGNIDCKHYSRFDDTVQFTLEQFLEKSPYKVGDKVLYKTYGLYLKIKSMLWNEEKEQVIYRLDSRKLFVATADELQPCKEQETMEELIRTEDITLEKSVMCTFLEMVEGKQRLRIVMKEGFELKEKKGNFFVYKKKGEYPKTLEELVELKFKVGDIVKHKTRISHGDVVTEIKDSHYVLNDELALPFIFQDEWELVPNKFDITTLTPFAKVLVRGDVGQKWTHDFFGFMDKNRGYPFVCVGHYVSQCIPYEGNEHLLGKTDDCDNYYKTWE